MTKLSATHKPVVFVELSLFIFVWLVCGLLINTRNLEAFNLQQAGIESMVERKQFSLEGSSTPQFQIKVYLYPDGKPFGDTFSYNGRQYAAKQPGQFMAGALVYFLLHLFGLSYLNHYLLTAALISFFTSSFLTAVAAVVVFRIAREFTAAKTFWWPFVSAIVYAFGTTAFPYSGFAYHDSMASAFLLIAFYTALLLTRGDLTADRKKLLAALTGLFLGLTVTTSMLPFFMAGVVAVYVFSLRQWNLLPYFVAGGIIGTSPLLVYNTVCFGNPLLQSYIAGDYPQSNLHFDLQNTIQKARLYVSELTLYDPLAWLGILGLAFLPPTLKRERLLIIALFAAQFFQVLNIESHGGCHYGPRFLLPSLPYAAIGLTGFYYLRGKTTQWIIISIAAIAALISLGVNATGALIGAMYCDVQVFAFWPDLALVWSGAWHGLPLAKWLIIPAIISVALMTYTIANLTSSSRTRVT